MTAKEKAKEIHKRFIFDEFEYYESKSAAIITVDEIIIALVAYGTDSDQLQNMDSELRWWESVKNEIKQL